MNRFTDPRTLARYATVAAIVLVVGGLFLQREVFSDGDTLATADGEIVLGITDPRDVAVGELAPDFVLASAEGQPIALSDFRGKTVVVNFWATWCPPCRAEMADFQQVVQERAARGDLVVVAVNLRESPSAVSDFAEEFELTFPIVLDQDGTVAQHFGILGLPATFFIDSQGVVREINLGSVFGHLLPDGIAAADAYLQ